MIVSGFTQKSTEEGGTLFGPFDHQHCMTCTRRDCSIRPDDISSCKLVDCPRGCPARFHACKEGEHVMLCMEERVPCINQGSGCPVVMTRNKLAQHLQRCPASVVCCTAEWNRAPLCPPKPRETPFLPKVKKLVDCGQLDLALAMRDHRALVDMMCAPKRTRRILRNPLTQRYPAAPFGRCSSQELENTTSEDTLGYNSDEDVELYWDTTRPWLSFRGRANQPLLQASRQTANSLSSALDLVSNIISHTGQVLTPHRPQQNPGLSTSGSVDVPVTSSVDDVSNVDSAVAVDGSSIGSNIDSTVAVDGSGVRSNVDSAIAAGSSSDRSNVDSTVAVDGSREVMPEQQNAQDTSTAQHVSTDSALPSSQHSDSVSPGQGVSGNLSQLSQDSGIPSSRGGVPTGSDTDHAYTATAVARWANSVQEQLEQNQQQAGNLSAGSDQTGLFVDTKLQGEARLNSQSPDSTARGEKFSSVSSEQSSPDGKTTEVDGLRGKMHPSDTSSLDGHPLHEILGVNLGVECITKYQPKQSFMYTFLCGQEFRRDQFPHHFHNVHNEIQSGLSGWMEQRCPLAYLGCPFSFRRFCPESEGTTVCHSWLHESFGLRSGWPDKLAAHQTPESLIPQSVKPSTWYCVGDSMWEQGLMNTRSDVNQEVSQLEPKDTNLDDIAASRNCSTWGDVDQQEEKADAASTSSFKKTTEREKQSQVDAEGGLLPATIGLSDAMDNSDLETSGSFAFLLDSIALDESVDSTQSEADKATDTDATRDGEASCNQGLTPGLTTDNRQFWHINKLTSSIISDTDEAASSTGAVGSPSSLSVQSSEYILQSAAQLEAEVNSGAQNPNAQSSDMAEDFSDEQFTAPPVLFTGAAPSAVLRLDHSEYCLQDKAQSLLTSHHEQLQLTDLPIEILHHIVQFLDSFSLYNLSLVSRQLRDICCNLLDEMGIVTLIWERRRDSRTKWHVAGKRWTFSLSFQPVHKWRFTGNNPISTHLQTCPFNRDQVSWTERFSIVPQNDTPCEQQIREYLEGKDRVPQRMGNYRVLPSYITWNVLEH